MLFAFLVSLPACVALASWPSFSLVVFRRDLECYQVDRGGQHNVHSGAGVYVR